MINDINTNLEILDKSTTEFCDLRKLNIIAYLADGINNMEAVEAYAKSNEIKDLDEIINVMMQEDDIEYYTYEFEGMENANNMSPEEKYGYTMLTLNGYLEKLQEMKLDWCIDVEKYGKADEQSGYVDLYENGYIYTNNNEIDLTLYDDLDYGDIEEKINEIANHEMNRPKNLKEIDNILKLEVGNGKTIEDFIKTTDEGNKLIPKNGNISSVTLSELNIALETEVGFKSITIENDKGKTISNNMSLIEIQKLADKEKGKQNSNEEEI